jgi:Protein of unknown function (DUF3887)
MNKFAKMIALSTLVLVLLVTSGCSAPKPAGLTDQQVASVTENILKALDAKNYQSFTRDFSNKMNSAFTQAQFDHLVSLLQTASGSYASLGMPSLTNNQGYAVYHFPAKYAKETVYVTITFLVGGQKVEGLWFDSANLRKASS